MSAGAWTGGYGKCILAPYHVVYGASELTFRGKNDQSFLLDAGDEMVFEKRIACYIHFFL